MKKKRDSTLKTLLQDSWTKVLFIVITIVAVTILSVNHSENSKEVVPAPQQAVEIQNEAETETVEEVPQESIPLEAVEEEPPAPETVPEPVLEQEEPQQGLTDELALEECTNLCIGENTDNSFTQRSCKAECEGVYEFGGREALDTLITGLKR